MKKILLITGCIAPNKNAIFLKVRDSNSRLEQYIKTLNRAFKKTNFDIVIFCENSNFKYNFSNLTKKSKKKFEYLCFQGDFEKSNAYGKGYGKGEIISHALNNSKYLKNSESFYRLIVENINDVLKNSKNNKNYFLNDLFCANTLDTKFYKIKKNNYIKYFNNTYKIVRDKEKYILENAFFDAFKSNKINFFNRYPIII